jgi:hypothetical protein
VGPPSSHLCCIPSYPCSFLQGQQLSRPTLEQPSPELVLPSDPNPLATPIDPGPDQAGLALVLDLGRNRTLEAITASEAEAAPATTSPSAVPAAAEAAVTAEAEVAREPKGTPLLLNERRSSSKSPKRAHGQEKRSESPRHKDSSPRAPEAHKS